MSRLQFLLSLLIISFCASLFFVMQGPLLAYQLAKPITTVFILLVPLLSPHSKETFSISQVLVGLSFCLVGDVLILWDSFFVFALASFLIGHLFFVAVLIQKGGLQLNYGILSLLGLVALVLYAQMYPNLGRLKLPVLIYVSCIVLMSWQALSLYVKNKNKATYWFALGAVLFLLSDSVLGLTKFTFDFSMSSVVILTAYWGGILSIAYATHFRI